MLKKRENNSTGEFDTEAGRDRRRALDKKYKQSRSFLNLKVLIEQELPDYQGDINFNNHSYLTE